MSAEEPARLALYSVLSEVIGSDNADTLMSALPVQSGIDLASKADMAELRTQMREIHSAIHGQNRLTNGAMTALTAIFSVVVGLIT